MREIVVTIPEMFPEPYWLSGETVIQKLLTIRDAISKEAFTALLDAAPQKFTPGYTHKLHLSEESFDRIRGLPPSIINFFVLLILMNIDWNKLIREPYSVIYSLQALFKTWKPDPMSDPYKI